MRPVVERLTQNGHNVVVLTAEGSLSIDSGDLYTTKTFSCPYSKEDLVSSIENYGSDHFKPPNFPGVTITMYHLMQKTFKIFREICEALLSNTELMQNLKDEKFDVVLTDPFTLCGMIVAEHLNVPNVNFLRGMPCTLDYISAQCPNPFSYVPRIFTQYSDKMTFAQRVKNVLVRMLEHFYCGHTYLPWLQMASNFLKKEVTVVELLSRTSIWLLRYDFVFEFPRPVMPNMVFIGGINCKPGKHLPRIMTKLPQIFSQAVLEQAGRGREGTVQRNERNQPTSPAQIHRRA
ncbi:UDP-glucuronosyltransferase 1A1-like [Eleutherodactylus coqui]|uniref:UDP-glucuronosyltransferase 1A1-like n=1 Tax=Eleutherodactylus coqui TaxID=57060 RepID=UPI0034632A7A